MLRQTSLGLALVLLLRATATAGQILYATAATADRIDGFCIQENGAIASDPFRERGTINNPRRLVVSGDVLYVAGNTRVEAFSIGADGRLTSLGRTLRISGANPRDIAVDPQRRMLYVPHRSRDRIAAYPLDASGAFTTGDFESCVRGPGFSGWEDIVIVDDRLYATSDSGRGHVFAYQIGDDGTLPEANVDPDEPDTGEASPCALESAIITDPLTERDCLDGAGALVVNDDILYVVARFRRRIFSFELASDGLFTPTVPIGDGGCKKLTQQKPATKTKELVRYLDLVRHGDTLLASFFDGGRVHAFPLVERDGRAIDLPKSPKRKTNRSFVRTPTRMTTAVSRSGRSILYVSGGQLNRIEAYRLAETRRGLLPKSRPFSKTNERNRSFPNDVIVTTVADACNG